MLNSASESRCIEFHVLHDSCSMANASASTTRGRSAEIQGSGFRAMIQRKARSTTKR